MTTPGSPPAAAYKEAVIGRVLTKIRIPDHIAYRDAAHRRVAAMLPEDPEERERNDRLMQAGARRIHWLYQQHAVQFYSESAERWRLDPVQACQQISATMAEELALAEQAEVAAQANPAAPPRPCLWRKTLRGLAHTLMYTSIVYIQNHCDYLYHRCLIDAFMAKSRA